MKGAYIVPAAFLDPWAVSPAGAQRATDVIAEFARDDAEREMFMDQLRPAPFRASESQPSPRRAAPRHGIEA